MRLIDLSEVAVEPITLFDSIRASSAELAGGCGESHIHLVRFDSGGVIGAHPTGFCQFFLVLDCAGWAAGADGQRIPLRAGQGVFFDRGEIHSKGSESGMIALMVQIAEKSEKRGKGEK